MAATSAPRSLLPWRFRWNGRHAGRLRYHLKGNIGMQYIREDDAPFFPASASRQAAAVQAATMLRPLG